jgi:hypothetical protein
MRDAFRFARELQEKVAKTNRRRRDEHRHEVKFDAGDMVWKYEHVKDDVLRVETVNNVSSSKLRYNFSGPYVIQRPSTLGPNLYYVTHVRDRKTTLCNVDLLVPVKNDCEDIGLPIGVTEQMSKSFDTGYKLAKGDMLMLDKSPDGLDNTPFAVGQVSYFLSDKTFVVRWFGNKTSNIRGAYAPSWFEGSTARRYYGERRANTHEKHCSAVSGTVLSYANVIGSPFRLTRKGAIPRQNLVEASRDTKTIWSLPRRDIVLFSAVAGQD